MEESQPIVEQEAQKLKHLADPEDLEQEAYVAILRQDDYLTPPEIRMTARWAMLAYLTRQKMAHNEAYAPIPDEDTEDSEPYILESEIGPDVAYNEAERAQLADKAQLVMGEAGEVLRRYYGLKPHTEPRTLDQIRTSMRLSKAQVFRLLQDGVASLQDLML